MEGLRVSHVIMARTVRIAAPVLMLAACGRGSASGNGPHFTGPPITTAITAATLDSLPVLAVSDGRLVCQADGESPCPDRDAAANWLDHGDFATWEPGRNVEVWSPGKVDPTTIGESGYGNGQYGAVLAVGAVGNQIAVLDGQRMAELEFDDHGAYRSTLPIPPVSQMRAVIFAGDIAVLQVIRMGSGDSIATFEVREIDTPGDTTGHVVLKLPLAWLRLHNGVPSVGLPLFPALPAYAVAADSDIIWTSGDVFTVRRQSPGGVVRWTLAGGFPGPPITDTEIARVRNRYQTNPDTVARRSVDSSIAHTGHFHPALSGIVAARDGGVLLAGAQIPGSDSVHFYLLDWQGRPRGRFVLPRQDHLLLFDGDSVLVQRPEPNLHQQMRWLRLAPPGGH